MMLKRAPLIKREIDMTPMIDCVFLLLIFFLVATQIKENETTRLRLPTAAAVLDVVKDMKPMPIVVNIVQKEPGEPGVGSRPYWVLGVPHSLDQLKNLLDVQARKQFEENGQNATVRIRADRGSELQQLQAAMKACQATKIDRLFIAAEKIRASF